MGRPQKPSISLAEALFSKVQLRVLSLLIGNPDRTFQTSELIRLAKSGTGAVQRELKKLTKAGILSCLSDGNRKLYRANKEAPIFEELNQIVLKTTGLVEPIRRALAQFQDKIRIAFVYGSIAKGTDTASSDVDVMIIGNDLSYGAIFEALQPAEKIIHRPINPNIMSISEWRDTLTLKNSFLKSIIEQPKLFVVGTEHELRSA